MNLFPKTQGSVQPAQIRRSTLTAVCLQRQGASLLTILSGCMGRRKAPGWEKYSPLAGQTTGNDGWPARKILYEAVKFSPQIISVLDSPTDLIFKNNNNKKTCLMSLILAVLSQQCGNEHDGDDAFITWVLQLERKYSVGSLDELMSCGTHSVVGMKTVMTTLLSRRLQRVWLPQLTLRSRSHAFPTSRAQRG